MIDAKLEQIITLSNEILGLREALAKKEADLSSLVNGPAVPQLEPDEAGYDADESHADGGGKKSYPRSSSSETLRIMKERNCPMDNGEIAVIQYGENTDASRRLVSAYLYTLKKQGLVIQPKIEGVPKRAWTLKGWTPPAEAGGGI